jgi:pyruvate/2-oxoglutarate dehydrogenase complex dihydrolipoamide acyltransferase (E2) component
MLEKEARRVGVRAAGSGSPGTEQAAPVLPPAAQPAAQPAALPAASAAPIASGSASGSAQGGSAFVTRRVAPAPAAPSLASVGQLAEEEGVVRGVCDGCGEDVLSSDEGRKREGSKYYHEACVRGNCGGCGRIVHAESDRVKLSGVYWHRDCA